MEEYEALKADIAENGVQVALIVNQNSTLLDGHTRWKIIQELGVEYPVEVKEFKTEIEEKLFVIDINLHRRHLNAAQQVSLGYLKEPYVAALAEQRMLKGKRQAVEDPVSNLPHGQNNREKRTREKIAADLPDVSPTQYQKGKKIIEAAKSDPEIKKDWEKAKAGKGSIHSVYKKVQQKEKDRKKVEPPVPLPENSERCAFYVSEVANLKDVADASVDWIITDPPYPEEYLPVYGDLAKTAKRVLKDGGGCLVMCGQSYLPEVIKRLEKHLTYHWCVSYLTPGGQAVQQFARKVNTFWKPVLWFVKGEYAGDWVGDVVKSDVNDNDKRFHEWGQSESGMADLIYRFTNAGDVILDPFVGGGTTAYVTLKMPGERRFIGADIDPKQVEITRQRVAEVLQ